MEDDHIASNFVESLDNFKLSSLCFVKALI